jgi:hypothetical protein
MIPSGALLFRPPKRSEVCIMLAVRGGGGGGGESMPFSVVCEGRFRVLR